MNPDTPQYYMPYDSENDTENDTGDDTDGDTDNESEDYDSDNLPDSEDARIRREEDPRYAIIAAAGPNFNTSAEQLKYMEHAPGATYDTKTDITSLSSLKYLDPPKTTQTSLFSIKSINRDTTVWKTPFNFQLKTPRVYKNVTKFQLVQISFPNNTTNFINSPAFILELATQLLNEGVSEDCISTCGSVSGCVPGATGVAVAEPGRLNASKEPMYTTIPISNGQYTNSELANELNINANNTPPFSVISFDTFKEEFKAHRDISILFNEPGDYFYTNVSKSRRGQHSKNDIMNAYYSNLHIDSFPIITDKIAFNAYYFPVLKEFVSLYTTTNVFIKTGIYSYKQVLDFVLGQFLGLNSDIYETLCSLNQGTLDNYRKLHTFELKHVNKYIFSYDEDARRFSVTHNQLHSSLQNDINNKYNALHNHSMSLKGFNNRSFQTLKTSYSHTNSVFKHLESYLSTVFYNYTLGGITNFAYTGGLIYGNSTIAEWDAHPGFSSILNFTNTFGAQLHGNYHGSAFTFTNFLDYHNTISSHYNTVSSTGTLISSVHGFTNSKHHEYISTKYTGILPHHVINNKSYIDSKGVGAAFLPHQTLFTPGEKIPYPHLAIESLSVVPPEALSGYSATPYSTCFTQCCTALENIVRKWYSCIPVNTVINQFPSYRLGIDFLNVTSFSNASATFNAASTTAFNLFLQINDFQSFNNMDVAMKENYSISNETTGQVKLMAAKLLLQGVGTGETSETAIQNPILFETPLGKLDKIDIKLYADDNSLTPMWQFFPFEIGVNEWDATFQIDEQVALADRTAGFSGNIPTIPIPNNPNAFQYMGLTEGNNSDNK
jgi:hypothetical protein